MSNDTIARTADARCPKYADEAAYPRPRIEKLTQQQRELTVLPEQYGLTKRELFAAMAMQGIFAHGYVMPNESAEAADCAVRAADCLLKELAK